MRDGRIYVRTDGFAEVSAFFRPHSKPATVRAWADRETEPGVNDAVIQIVEDPNSGCSAINLPWEVTSIGDR